MSTITTKQAVPSIPSVRTTVEEFEKTAFYHDVRVELIDGCIVRRDEGQGILADRSGRHLATEAGARRQRGLIHDISEQVVSVHFSENKWCQFIFP